LFFTHEIIITNGGVNYLDSYEALKKLGSPQLADLELYFTQTEEDFEPIFL